MSSAVTSDYQGLLSAYQARPNIAVPKVEFKCTFFDRLRRGWEFALPGIDIDFRVRNLNLAGYTNLREVGFYRTTIKLNTFKSETTKISFKEAICGNISRFVTGFYRGYCYTPDIVTHIKNTKKRVCCANSELLERASGVAVKDIRDPYVCEIDMNQKLNEVEQSLRNTIQTLKSNPPPPDKHNQECLDRLAEAERNQEPVLTTLVPYALSDRTQSPDEEIRQIVSRIQKDAPDSGKTVSGESKQYLPDQQPAKGESILISSGAIEVKG